MSLFNKHKNDENMKKQQKQLEEMYKWYSEDKKTNHDSQYYLDKEIAELKQVYKKDLEEIDRIKYYDLIDLSQDTEYMKYKKILDGLSTVGNIASLSKLGRSLLKTYKSPSLAKNYSQGLSDLHKDLTGTAVNQIASQNEGLNTLVNTIDTIFNTVSAIGGNPLSIFNTGVNIGHAINKGQALKRHEAEIDSYIQQDKLEAQRLINEQKRQAQQKNTRSLAESDDIEAQRLDKYTNIGSSTKYIANQQKRYREALSKGDKDLQNRLVADAKRVGYKLTNLEEERLTDQKGNFTSRLENQQNYISYSQEQHNIEIDNNKYALEVTSEQLEKDLANRHNYYEQLKKISENIAAASYIPSSSGGSTHRSSRNTTSHSSNSPRGNEHARYIEKNYSGGLDGYIKDLDRRAAAGKEENIKERVRKEKDRIGVLHEGGFVGGQALDPQHEKIARLLKGELVLNNSHLNNIPNIFTRIFKGPRYSVNQQIPLPSPSKASGSEPDNVINVCMNIDKVLGDKDGAKVLLTTFVRGLKAKGVIVK